MADWGLEHRQLSFRTGLLSGETTQQVGGSAAFGRTPRLLWPLLSGLVPHCTPWKWLEGRREDGWGAEPEGEALGRRPGRQGRKGCREGLCPSRAAEGKIKS